MITLVIVSLFSFICNLSFWQNSDTITGKHEKMQLLVDVKTEQLKLKKYVALKILQNINYELCVGIIIIIIIIIFYTYFVICQSL